MPLSLEDVIIEAELDAEGAPTSLVAGGMDAQAQGAAQDAAPVQEASAEQTTPSALGLAPPPDAPSAQDAHAAQDQAAQAAAAAAAYPA